MILERIESETTRQDKTREEKQSEIIDEKKSKEIITHTNVHKYRSMINDRNNNKRNEERNTRITMPQ